jgi:hypothetical protein
MALTPAGVKFNWSICGAEGETDENLLENKHNVTYSGRSGTDNADDKIPVGGYQDQIYLNDPGNYGVLKNKPLKTVYLGTEWNDLSGAPSVCIRFDYDIVTLTTAEQAELYQRGLCG